MLEYLTALDLERPAKVTHLLEAVLQSLASFALVFLFVFAGFTISFHVWRSATIALAFLVCIVPLPVRLST
eukprot:818182-Amphidinium_carterae.1